MSTPMTPGSKSEHLEDVIDLAWNNEGTYTMNNIITDFFNRYI